jgi:hypothetical protein
MRRTDAGIANAMSYSRTPLPVATSPCRRLGRGWLIACAIPFLNGCAGQIGSAGGFALHDPSSSSPQTRFVWSNQTIASTVLGMQRGVYIGAEIESRFEHALGSRWTSGVQFGYGFKPNSRPWSLGFEAHVDAGTPLRNQALFSNGDWYGGATIATPIWAAQRHETTDGSPEQWFLVRTAEVVPFARARFHLDHETGTDGAVLRQDYAAGVAIRLRLVSDFF